jgi:hypothetical protein
MWVYRGSEERGARTRYGLGWAKRAFGIENNKAC